jgi:hypothetical protein
MKYLGLIGFVCITVLFATFMALSEISSHQAEEKNVEQQVLKMKTKYLYSEFQLMEKIDEQELTIMQLNHKPQTLIDSTRDVMEINRKTILERIRCELVVDKYKASIQNFFDEDNEEIKKFRKVCGK